MRLLELALAVPLLQTVEDLRRLLQLLLEALDGRVPLEQLRSERHYPSATRWPALSLPQLHDLLLLAASGRLRLVLPGGRRNGHLTLLDRRPEQRATLRQLLLGTQPFDFRLNVGISTFSWRRMSIPGASEAGP